MLLRDRRLFITRPAAVSKLYLYSAREKNGGFVLKPKHNAVIFSLSFGTETVSRKLIKVESGQDVTAAGSGSAALSGYIFFAVGS